MKTQNDPNNVMTESTAVKSNPEIKKKKGMSPLWTSVLVGGVPGILLGAAGTMGVDAVASTPDPEVEEPVEEQAAEPVLQAHSVNDDMSFNDAFAAARAEVGPGGAFVWHGHVYGTYRADDEEWIEMSDEERAAHSEEILSQVHATPYTPTDDEPEIIPVDEEETDGEPIEDYDEAEDVEEVEDIEDVVEPAVPAEDAGEVTENTFEEPADEPNDIDVHILGVGGYESAEGAAAQFGVGLVNDHTAVFADTDGDNEVDTVLIDTNDNGDLDEGETFDATDAGIMMDDLRAQMEAEMSTGMMDDSAGMEDNGDADLTV